MKFAGVYKAFHRMKYQSWYPFWFEAQFTVSLMKLKENKLQTIYSTGSIFAHCRIIKTSLPNPTFNTGSVAVQVTTRRTHVIVE